MTDFAFLKIDRGRFLCGTGPFEARAEPPTDEDEVAFFRNDFLLSDPVPWKVPEKWFVTADPTDLLPDNGATPFPSVEWNGLRDEDFRRVFDDIKTTIQSGGLEKSVPVITERGRLRGGRPEGLIRALVDLPESLWSYGFAWGDRGAVGATPEQLFTLHGDRLKTMALAGTAPKHEAGSFVSDGKEIREHEFVADFLVGRLEGLGEVSRREREVLDLGSIVHFLSSIELRLKPEFLPADLNSLIRRLHPTPALGACPRGDGALRQLHGYRTELGTPGGFGAPFGVAWREGFHCVVAIRSMGWSGDEVYLPSGVGLIEESRFEHEWRELSLKRNAVKSLLGV
jgi:menaquinone-specific isochorismate synthase